MNQGNDLRHPGSTELLQVRGAKLITLRQHCDDRGPIAILGQGDAPLPFHAKRLFLTYAVTAGRGAHAHRQCQQLLLCAAGSVTVLIDDGQTSQEIMLCSPAQALYVPPMVWAEQFNHSHDAVLMVAASDDYDAADYLRTREAWLEALADKAA